jgi:putative ABC transport system permease protein
MPMSGHSFKVAFRNMKRHKGYTFINIAGLAVGMACTILILLWVRDETGYDRFHKKVDRIYRVVFSTSEDGMPTNANGSLGVGPALKKDFPEVIETVRIRKMERSTKRYVGYRDKKFYESRFFFAETSVFSVFDFPLVRGDAATALEGPDSIVLTEDMAKKYFGNEDPIGKVIEADPYSDGKLMFFRITGIARNVPGNSHFHFDFLASYKSLREDTLTFSGFYQHYTYVLLDNPSSAASLNPKLLDFLHRNWRKDPWYTISLQPLLDIRLRSALRSEVEPTGSILYVYIFTAIALSVLVIACINFMNLATARSAKRAKEVGIRKVAGAPKSQLVRQFLGESLSLGVFSAGAAVLLVIMTLPVFNRLTGKGLTLSSLTNLSFILGTAVIAIGVGFVSGIYPAFFLSAFQPIHSLKTRSGHPASGASLRKGLVIFQFALSIGIIFATLVVHKQMRYIQSRDLGYDKEQILVIPLNEDLRRNYEGFRNELLKNPGIENVTTSSFVPTGSSMHQNMRFEGRADEITQVIYSIGKEFVGTYGLELLAGKDIQRPISQDGTSEFLVSELTTREAGYSSPREAVGKSVGFEEYKGHIVGVVKDINIYSLHQQPYPIVYFVSGVPSHNYLSIRIGTRNVSQSMDHIRKIWREMVLGFPLDYFFLDVSFEQMHIAEKKMSMVFSGFSILAIFVACLGLFGLAAYTAEQRTKEIGVRKVLGASASSIYVLLSREFLKWVALANLIAWPVAYFAIHRWLRNFAYRVGIGWDVFLASAGVALAISIVIVSTQSVKAAGNNPIDSLRYE